MIFFFSVEFYCCDPSFFPSENLQLSSKVSEYLLAIPRRDGGRQRDAARKRRRNGGALSRICQPLDPFPTAEITSSHVGRSMQHLSQQPIENAIPGAPLYSLFFFRRQNGHPPKKRREMCATLSHVSQTIDLFKKPLPFFAGPKNVDTRQRGTFFIGSEQTLQMGGD